MFRDFLIGAVMVAFIMQLLPESATSLITTVLGWMPTSMPSMKMIGGASDDMEVQVGVPKF